MAQRAREVDGRERQQYKERQDPVEASCLESAIINELSV